MAVPRAPRIFSIFVASIIFQQRLSAARENVQLPRCPKIRQLAFEAEFSGGGEKCERNVASAGRGNSPVQGIQISFLRLLTLLIFPRPPLFARSETNKAREKAGESSRRRNKGRSCLHILAGYEMNKRPRKTVFLRIFRWQTRGNLVLLLRTSNDALCKSFFNKLQILMIYAGWKCTRRVKMARPLLQLLKIHIEILRF